MSMESHGGACVAEKMRSSRQNFQILERYCIDMGWQNVMYWTEYTILILGTLANVTLLWLFLREVKSQSASKVLGMNLAVMGLLYTSVLPSSLIFESINPVSNGNETSGFNESNPIFFMKDAFNMLNLIGCPLLLTCMCVERYLAVMHPVLYLRLRKWKNLCIVSAVVWMITFSFCLSTVWTDPTSMRVIACIAISALFFVMLSCLGVVVWSLRQQSPAHTNPAQSRSSIKKQAVTNVLFVVLPTVASYLPTVGVIPIILYIISTGELQVFLCHIFQFCTLLPRFGVLIGPTFYLAKARQMFCMKGKRKT